MLQIIRKFFQFCGPENGRKFRISIALGVLMAFFEALKIPAIAWMVKALIAENIRYSDCLSSFLIMLISIVGAGLIKSKATMLQTEAGYHTCARKRMEIAQHMRYLPMGYFTQQSLGQITSVTTNVLESLENVATRVIMMVSQGILTTSLIVVMLLCFDYRIAILLLVGFILFLLSNRLLQKKSEHISEEKMEVNQRMIEKIMEYLQGMSEVKSYHLIGEKCRELNDAITRDSQVSTEMELVVIPYMVLQNMIAKLTGTAMALYTCWLFTSDCMDTLTAIVMIISSFIVYSSLESAGNYSALLRIVNLCVDKVEAIMEAKPMDISGEQIHPKNMDLVADHISFSYDKKKIIDDISLKIPSQTTTALVGPSGGGKTTLINLLARFWDVEQGEITLGGHNIKDYEMDSLMKNFSYVFQNVYLFHDTIANNIRFGNPQSSMEEVMIAAKKACCHEFIQALPDGYETIIGEGGASLSGGERQRLSIARAIMKDSPIILLDEVTANVDSENENELMKAIEELTKEKTVIMIAHRLKTVEHADQIFVVDKGCIVQSGKHEDLIKEDGIYKRFILDRKEAASWRVRA